MTKTYTIELEIPKTPGINKREVQKVLKLNGFIKTSRRHPVWRLIKEMEQGTWMECLNEYLESIFENVNGITFTMTGEFNMKKSTNLQGANASNFNSGSGC